MRPGTPGFIAERLVSAREARGISTQLALAGLIGMQRTSVSRWENGTQSPDPEALDLLAQQLNVRRAHLIRPMPDHGDGAFFYRARANVEKAVRATERARLRWVQDISLVLQHYFEFPQYDVPDLLKGHSYQPLSDEDIERIALDLRGFWGVGEGPITSMIGVLEARGFVVARDLVGSGRLDGVCNWSEADGRPYILLAKDKRSFFRSQMDAAHEMAHAILHRGVDQKTFESDFERIESQAFRLASAFLMPSTTFVLEARHPSLAVLQTLKERWRVSVKAMIKRCDDLHIISKDAAQQLYKHYSAKGWNRGEPLDSEFPEDEPRLLGRAIKDLVDSGLRSKQDLLANEFTIPAVDVEKLVALPPGWFDVAGEVVPLTLRPRPSSNVGGTVLPFQKPGGVR